MNQVIGQSICDRGQSSHAARDYNHPQGDKRAAGNRRTLIAKRIIMRCHILNLLDRMIRFMDKRAGAPFTHHHVRFDA